MKRTRFAKKRYVRKRKGFRKSRKPKGNILFLKRFINPIAFGGSVGGVSASSQTFRLQDTPNYTELVNLFDQYKLTGVAYKWVLREDPNINTGAKYNVRIWTAKDFNDASIPASISEIQQYNNCRFTQLSQNRYESKWTYFKPSKLQALYASALGSGYSPTWKGFVSTQNYDLNHYGIKFYIDGNGTGQYVELHMKYYIAVKNTI
jgi:hypothetical protein